MVTAFSIGCTVYIMTIRRSAQCQWQEVIFIVAVHGKTEERPINVLQIMALRLPSLAVTV